jgi:hypothetical protein
MRRNKKILYIIPMGKNQNKIETDIYHESKYSKKEEKDENCQNNRWSIFGDA